MDTGTSTNKGSVCMGHLGVAEPVVASTWWTRCVRETLLLIHKVQKRPLCFPADPQMLEGLGAPASSLGLRLGQRFMSKGLWSACPCTFSSCIPTLSNYKEAFLEPFIFHQRNSVPGTTRPLCPTSLSIYWTVTSLQADSSDIFRDHQQHHRSLSSNIQVSGDLHKSEQLNISIVQSTSLCTCFQAVAGCEDSAS